MLNIVVYIAGNYTWNNFHRRPMLEALARNAKGKINMLIINPTVTLALRPRYWFKSMQGWRTAKDNVQRVTSNLFIYTPKSWLHPILRILSIGRAIYRKRLIQQTHQALKQVGMDDGVRVAWVFRPEQIGSLGLVNEQYVVYECYDEYQLDISTGEFLPEVQENESALLSKASVVFATSRSLCNKRRSWHPRIYIIPNGADVEHFSKARDENTPIAPELREIKKPIIGYPGDMSSFVDIELIQCIADSHKDWSIVLLGRIREGVSLSTLKLRKNVYYLGYKPHELLPTFSKAFDVVILPFIMNQFLKHSNPLTLWEQMAAGNLIVATNFNQDVRELSDIVWTASSNESFIDSIEEALSENHSSRIKKGLQLAQEHSWDLIARRHLQILNETCDKCRIT